MRGCILLRQRIARIAGKEIYFDYLIHIFSVIIFLGFLACQPRNKPGAEKSEH
jgi:hypothetical protein